MRIIYILALVVFTISYALSQSVENVHFEQQGKQIHIYYDFNGEAGEKYTIKVYCSEDGGDTWGDALLMVSGAVGENQLPGGKKKIIWKVLSEREKLTGDVTFMITAEDSGFTGNRGVFTDERDGKVYKWVRIGKQVWMAENLNVGSRIDGKDKQKSNGRIEKYCYDDKESNCATYGALYQWDEAMQYVTTNGVRGICLKGWHIPTDGEWGELVDFLGGKKKVGGKMKEVGYEHWASPNKSATNSSGFTGLPGGGRYSSSGSFYTLGYSGYFWSSSQYDASNAWHLDLYWDGDDVFRHNINKTTGFSVRCLQD